MAKYFPEGGDVNSDFWPWASFKLPQGDVCKISDFVIAANANGRYIGRIHEIAQSTRNELSPDPDGILLQHFVVDRPTSRYGMPYLIPTNSWSLSPATVSVSSVKTTDRDADVGY
jgi:hypothetical protein